MSGWFLFFVLIFLGSVFKLFIGGLPGVVSKDDLHRELTKFGHVVDLWVARNPPGFAFVKFNNFNDADKALHALNGSSVFGPKIRVEFAHNGPRNDERSHQSGDWRQHSSLRNGRSPPRRYGSPRRGRSSPPPMFPPGARLERPYDNFASFYDPEMLNATASLPFQSGYPNMLPYARPLKDSFRGMRNSHRFSPRMSPSYRRRSRSPGDRRLSSYDRYREGENGSFRRRRSGSRDRRRRPSPLPPPPPVPLSPYRRNSPPYEHHYTPYLPSGEIGTFGGRFHQSYGDRSHSRSRMPDRRRRH